MTFPDALIHIFNLLLVGSGVYFFWIKFKTDQETKSGYGQISRKNSKRIKVSSFQPELVEYCVQNQIPLIFNADGIFLVEDREFD